MKKILISLTAATIVFVGSAIATENPIGKRRAIMQNVGAAAKIGGAMLKGQEEYSPAAGQLILRVMNTATQGVGELFPVGSEIGNDTTASSKIWEDRAGFKAAMAKFRAETAEEILKPEEIEFFDQETFGAAFVKIVKNCAACHETYRIKQN